MKSAIKQKIEKIQDEKYRNFLNSICENIVCIEDYKVYLKYDLSLNLEYVWGDYNVLIPFLNDDLALQIMTVLSEENEITEYTEAEQAVIEFIVKLPINLKQELLDIIRRLKNFDVYIQLASRRYIEIQFKNSNLYVDLFFNIKDNNLLEEQLLYNEQIVTTLENCYMIKKLKD